MTNWGKPYGLKKKEWKIIEKEWLSKKEKIGYYMLPLLGGGAVGMHTNKAKGN